MAAGLKNRAEYVVNIVDALRKHGRMTVAEVAQRSNCTTGAVKRNLAVLERRHWVRRAGVAPKVMDENGNKPAGISPTLWECCL